MHHADNKKHRWGEYTYNEHRAKKIRQNNNIIAPLLKRNDILSKLLENLIVACVL